ncbi:hypothetical protein RIB2604_03600620 [Aspergillus luchuensis]|uniref:Uncharacterized protein n=1 Tax=Aspergillus kawachii TaxID=1069201 RepID=A0A146G1G5_ASPKA|nr:hypothetical protein RIB2604_03600620 [Aspergillus luchuensis]
MSIHPYRPIMLLLVPPQLTYPPATSASSMWHFVLDFQFAPAPLAL